MGRLGRSEIRTSIAVCAQLRQITLMPPNIYRTVPESLESFDYVMAEGKFSRTEKFLAKYEHQQQR